MKSGCRKGSVKEPYVHAAKVLSKGDSGGGAGPPGAEL